MKQEASVFEELYSLYLARLRQIRLAMHRRDGDALRLIELELGSLPQDERHVLAMAVHDVAAGRPRLAKTHFLRTLLAERSETQEQPARLR